MSEELARAFVSQAISHLQDEFLPKIRKCVDLLTEEELWWKSSEPENSVGNLLLHLSGNVRQWIISGLGGEQDRRDRPSEFAARGGTGKGEAMRRLEETVKGASRVLDSLSQDELLRGRTIQGFDRTGLQAAFHVVEHFSYHTGQIVFITKQLKRTDLRFYDL